jgi:hypothetical protein
MHSSPVPPSVTGARSSPTTSALIPGYGCPIGTLPCTQSAGPVTGSQRNTVQAMVSSVGPYRFSSTECGAAACHACAVPHGSASPQNRLQRSVGILPGARLPRRASTAATDGTENHTVISSRSR